jgi:Bifunctional DNA primase/polymerase, N-terminal
MAGVFATAQPKYAALGIATFPFDATEQVKRGPLVSHYSRMGLPASRQMALRFPDAPGLAGARNRFTIVDIDEKGAAGERLLADVQRQFGNSKVITRTGSGGFHCYYLHNGEGRKIRPDPRKPIDLIGAGPIVLPPSRGFRGNYEIIHGPVDDLAKLEPIRTQPLSSASLAATDIDLRSARDGGRDKKFWPHVARQAHLVRSLNELIDGKGDE